MNKKLVKICIFDKNSTPSAVITGNGDAILDNICTSAISDEVFKTAEYYLDAVFLIDEEGLYSYIEEESILKVLLDYGNEYFRIAKVLKTSRDITVFARQITISETLDMWLEDVRPENQNGQSAISWIKDNSIGKKDINVYSDIQDTDTAYYIDMNMYKALHDCDNSFLERWGGEVQRRGYNLYINNHIGTHRGVQIRSNKNLTGFEATTNIDNIVTRIKPKGYDGITIDGFVDSPLINKYSSIKTKEIKYEDVKVKTEEDDEGFNTLAEAQAELIRRANLEFTQNHIDELRGEYRINFVQLEQTEEYKNYVAAERVFLGDDVDVYEDKLGINITVRAIRKQYDILRQKVIEIELSNDTENKKTTTINQVLNKIEEVKESNKWFEEAINNATDLIENGLKDSYVVHRKNEILIMDTTDINTATNVWRWNAGGLAHSSTGYYGKYSTAITQDGGIVATMISSGILNANLIKTGVIRNHNNDFEINLDDGTIKVNSNKFKVTVDGKEENIATKTQMEQTAKGLEIKVSESGPYNYVENGQFKNGTSSWSVNGNASLTLNNPYQLYEGTGLMVICNEANAGIYQLIDTIPGETYSYSFMINSEINVIAGIEDLGSVVYPDAKYTWTRYTGTFTATKTSHAISFYSYHYTGCFYISNIVIAKGEIAPMYLPSPSEFYEGITSIDKNGVTVNQSNINGYTQMSADKFLLNKDGKDLFKVDHEGLYLEGKVKITSGLDGTSTNGEDGRKVTIDKANYTISENNQERAFLGFKNMGNGYDKYVVPKLALGAYGYNLNHNYFTIIPYRGGSDNPQNSSKAYVDIAYHMISHDDYSNIKMYDGGDIRLAPVKNLEITTNYENAEYKGIEERRLALFTTSTSGYYNGHLQIGAVVNMTNGNGLVLEDSRNGKWVNVHVHVDSTGAKFFRPLENGTTQNGSASFRWDRVFSVNADNVSSDRRLKENIKYLETTPNTNATQSEEYNLQDFYNFVKDDLYLTTYNFIEGDKSVKYGFMAQDLMGTKIGDNIVTSEQAEEGEDTPYLGYDIMNYTHSLAGALKVAIQEIEKLKEEIKTLKGGV